MIQLIDQFLKNKSKKFILYIYLKGLPTTKKTLSVTELDSILGRTKKFSNTDKADFIKSFTLIYAEDFESQYKLVIEKIKTSYSKTSEEAAIYYSVISSHLLEIVTKYEPSKSSLRVTSKGEIDKIIANGKKLIFKSAFVELLTKEKQLKHLNKLFFRTSINKEPFDRIFIIELANPVPSHILKDLVLTLKTKWSKNKTKSIPDNDRFIPYIFLKGISKVELVELKTELQIDGYKIKDGHNFMDSLFNMKSFKERPTFFNRYFFKFINTKKDLDLILKKHRPNN